MLGSGRRRVTLIAGLALVVIGFGLAAMLDSSVPALLGTLGLVIAVLAVERWPRNRGW